MSLRTGLLHRPSPKRKHPATDCQTVYRVCIIQTRAHTSRMGLMRSRRPRRFANQNTFWMYKIRVISDKEVRYQELGPVNTNMFEIVRLKDTEVEQWPRGRRHAQKLTEVSMHARRHMYTPVGTFFYRCYVCMYVYSMYTCSYTCILYTYVYNIRMYASMHGCLYAFRCSSVDRGIVVYVGISPSISPFSDK